MASLPCHWLMAQNLYCYVVFFSLIYFILFSIIDYPALRDHYGLALVYWLS